DLGVPAKTVLEMESRLSGHDITFDLGDDSDESETSSYAPAQYLAAANADPAGSLGYDDWQSQNIDKLGEALDELDDRSRDILNRRWLDETKKPTLHDLAAEYGVSAERIRQLEANAIKKLRSAIET